VSVHVTEDVLLAPGTLPLAARHAVLHLNIPLRVSMTLTGTLSPANAHSIVGHDLLSSSSTILVHHYFNASNKKPHCCGFYLFFIPYFVCFAYYQLGI
jgi:hypothetical protein